MNLEARVHPERTERNARLKQGCFTGSISRGNNLHFVFLTAQHLISINLRSVPNDLKADWLFIYFPSSRSSWSHHKDRAGPPSETETDLTFAIPLPFGGDYHPGATFHSVQKDMTLLP